MFNPLFSKEKECKIKKVKIMKFSEDIHFSGSYNCTAYDTVFRDMSIDQKTLDTIIRNESMLEKFRYIFSDLQRSQKDRCHGRPQIKIVVYFSNSSNATFYLQEYTYLMTEKGVFFLKDDNLKLFLAELGGFK